MKKIAILTASFVLTAGMCVADDSDDTLTFYLSKSDLIVLGTIVSEPAGQGGEGVLNYNGQFKVSDVCKGDAKFVGLTILVNIARFEMKQKDRHPLIKKDAECILFLKLRGPGAAAPPYVTADFWFGIQYPAPSMVKSLKRLAAQDARGNKTAKPGVAATNQNGFAQIPVQQIGQTLDEAVKKLGKWDPVGDVGPGPDGNMGYPFSNRDGYDYKVCVGVGGKVTSVWRRKTADFVRISAAAPPATKSLSLADSSSAALRSSFVFKAGEAVSIRLRYAGNAKNWDAGFEMQKESLVTSNSATIILTDSKGKSVAPRKDKILNLQYDQIMAKPFNVTIDVVTLYDISQAGVYKLEWGCKQVQTQVVDFEIKE